MFDDPVATFKQVKREFERAVGPSVKACLELIPGTNILSPVQSRGLYRDTRNINKVLR